MPPSFSTLTPRALDRVGIDLEALRRDPAARLIVRRWRRLTGGRRTLVAVSGGADSSALALTLASAEPAALVIGHVRHEMRTEQETAEDRDAVVALAERLGAPMVEARIGSIEGNEEDAARRARRSALTVLARERECVAVAVGHTADDQAETVLMSLMRGAGPRGLAGMPESCQLGEGIRLVRPMLACMRGDAERLCRLAGHDWREDRTNLDETRARAFLRARVIPELRSRWPRGVERSAAAAGLLADAAGLIEDRAREVFGASLGWRREALVRERDIVIGDGLRSAWRRLTGGAGADRLSQRRVGVVLACIRDTQMRDRVFRWPGGVRVQVGARLVTMRRTETEKETPA